MLWCGVFAVVLVAFAQAATVQEANHFMDTVLNERLPPLVRASPNLFPVVPIPFFRFDVPRNAPTNRNLHANITEGAIRNLDVGVKRMGECLVPAVKDGVPTVSCTLDLNSINTTFLAYTKGDNILSTLKEIWVNVLTVDSIARFEATGVPRRESVLRTFEVPHLHFTTLYDHELHLNTDRQRQFKDHIEAKVKETLQETLYGDYRLQLARAVAATPFPDV
uniref:Putative cytotoxin-like protein n=1 Tax=Ixodes ricinus TaxID=34613 RepID=A0A0K8R9K4_IXORI